MYDRTIKSLDTIMEFGVYLYIFALFNQGTTALSSLGLYLPLIAWTAKHVLTKGRQLGYLLHPLAVAGILFCVLMFISTLYAPDLIKSLDSYRKSIGTVLFLLFTVGDVFQAEKRQRRFLYVFVLSGIYLNALQVNQHIATYQATGHFMNMSVYGVFRPYSDALAFFLPFTLAVASITKSRLAFLWWAAFIVQAVLLLVTGVRGAWLGFGLALAVWVALKADKRIIMFAATTAIAVAILAAGLPNSIVKDRVKEGLSSTGRLQGTWGPTHEMMLDKPLLGYGYGKSVYHEEFNRRAPSAPSWLFKKSLGPHSNYLEIGFAAGIIGLLSLVLLYGKFFGQLFNFLRRPTSPFTTYFGLAVLSSFTAQYLVRGFVESSRWQPFGVLLGIAVALLVSGQALQKKVKT